MVRIIPAALAGAVLLAAAAAAAQDAAPPGCRWQGGGTLACKDGRGHWRRSGDGEIVGSYPMGRPQPKPVAAPAPPPAAPAPPPPPDAPVQAAPPAPSPPASVPQPAPPPPAAAPPPQPARSWWRRWLDDIWSDLQAFLHLLGLKR
ncbi:hypothetical protein [Phenylobacterium sp.]|jgi:hypothetical protein|uniref:hypothetical protein n=1 Tax=Phenylobacterium sp. TaxID=1871053 RepID=UPI002F3E910E